jgi:hypothetical protein
VIPDPGTVTVDHATEVVRPGSVLDGIEDDAVEAAGAQLLRLGRETEKGVGLAGDKALHGIAAKNPVDVLLGIEADLSGHDRQV